jgi:hypothetical protein
LDGSNGVEYWRERAQQLEHALQSRIGVEQAKGILSERLGLSVDAAFALLRQSARDERIKLHDLAQQVVDNDDTPQPIIRAMAKYPAVLTRAPRTERVVQTELFFRAINEEIARIDGETLPTFICECGNPICTEGVDLVPADLRRLQATPGLFVVVPGHEIPDIETVVSRGEGHLIVHKNL